jgi:hypothetical protein
MWTRSSSTRTCCKIGLLCLHKFWSFVLFRTTQDSKNWTIFQLPKTNWCYQKAAAHVVPQLNWVSELRGGGFVVVGDDGASKPVVLSARWKTWRGEDRVLSYGLGSNSSKHTKQILDFLSHHSIIKLLFQAVYHPRKNDDFLFTTSTKNESYKVIKIVLTVTLPVLTAWHARRKENTALTNYRACPAIKYGVFFTFVKILYLHRIVLELAVSSILLAFWCQICELFRVARGARKTRLWRVIIGARVLQ